MLHILPEPINITVMPEKKGFKLSKNTTVTPYDFSADFIDFVKKALGIEIHAEENAEEKNSVILTIDGSVKHDEGYILKCENDCVQINAKTETGLFYGLQTLRQLLLQTDGDVPCVTIEDRPRFSYRGYMFDCGRYFFSVEDVKRVIDLMALHKLNVLHWHLTEDQGWRVEIKKYPLLTEKGSKRSHTNFNHKPHGGYFTQEDIKEIVQYCHARKIKVIPEFDIPGHTVSAIACYPYLSCFDRKLEVATHWGVKHDILCAGKESTYQFVFDVLDELMSLFPDKIIHLGGDEAVKMRWELCPRCQAEMKKLGLKSEDDLQAHFMEKVSDYLRQHGYSSIMWNDENMKNEKKPDPQIGWTVYGKIEGRAELNGEAAEGRKLINTCHTHYLDFPYGWTSIQEVCEEDGSLTDDDSGTWGVEGCMWTEYVPNMKKLEFLTFPRLGAIAETAWAKKGSLSFSAFKGKAADYYKLLDVYNVNYAKMSKAQPSVFYKHASSIWFKRRVFHWQGLHNRTDDAKAAKEAAKIKSTV